MGVVVSPQEHERLVGKTRTPGTQPTGRLVDGSLRRLQTAPAKIDKVASPNAGVGPLDGTVDGAAMLLDDAPRAEQMQIGNECDSTRGGQGLRVGMGRPMIDHADRSGRRAGVNAKADRPGRPSGRIFGNHVKIDTPAIRKTPSPS